MNYAELEKISPVELCKYLARNGWVAGETDQDMITYSLIQTDETFEVEAPLNNQIRDYPSRVRDVLVTVGIAETRTPDEIAQEIVFGTDDEWQWRYDYVERHLPTIIRAVENVTRGISQLEADGDTPSMAAKMASLSRLIDSYVNHDVAVMMAAYAILNNAGAVE